MKKVLISILIFIALILGLYKGLEYWLEAKFEKIINTNPDRQYDIEYEKFDLNSFFQGIKLSGLSIYPLNKESRTLITGKVKYAELSGFIWWQFLKDESLKIEQLSFIEPEFQIDIQKKLELPEQDSTSKSKPAGIQNLFGDIISRVGLDNFQIVKASLVRTQDDSLILGQMYNMNLFASAIRTDSMHFTNIIPFELKNLEVQVDSAFYRINDYTKAKLGAIFYSIADESMSIHDLSLNYSKNWIDISHERGIQDDVIEFNMKALSISGVNYSSAFWTDLDINASTMKIDSLNLFVRRNKNLKRPPDVRKPLFQGMVEKIPIKLDLDSIIILQSNVLYGELGSSREHTGEIEINDINGVITRLTTFPERKNEFESFEAHLEGKLNNAGQISANLKVPYSEDKFSLNATMSSMDMTALSPSLIPLMGVEINNGTLKKLEFNMNAAYYGSQNHLVMDYENLHFLVYKEEDDGSEHKKALLSLVANTAIRHHNLPEEKGYETATYASSRNIYRSPIQHLVAALLDGMKSIVPGKGIQKILQFKNEHKKHKKKKSKS